MSEAQVATDLEEAVVDVERVLAGHVQFVAELADVGDALHLSSQGTGISIVAFSFLTRNYGYVSSGLLGDDREFQRDSRRQVYIGSPERSPYVHPREPRARLVSNPL